MLRLPDRPINERQLITELAALDLPGLTGVARLSRDVDGQGRAVRENGAVRKVAPYILVKSDSLSEPQKAAVEAAVARHVPVFAPPSTDAEIAERQFRGNKALLAMARIVLGDDVLITGEVENFVIVLQHRRGAGSQDGDGRFRHGLGSVRQRIAPRRGPHYL